MTLLRKCVRYKISISKRFKKSMKALSASERELVLDVVQLLASAQPLAPSYKDHALKGEYAGFRDCHVKPDLVLIYRVFDDILELYLARCGKPQQTRDIELGNSRIP